MKPRGNSISARDIAQKIHAVIYGDSALVINGLSPLETPSPHTITFIRSRSKLAVEKSLQKLPRMAVLVESAFMTGELGSLSCTILAVKNPHRSFLDLIPLFYEEEEPTRSIHPSAVIDPTCVIGSRVSIGANSVVGAGVSIGDDSVIDAHVNIYPGARIGERTRLYSGVVVRERCRIGHDTVIHNNSVIGSDGFGYISEPDIGLKKVPQVGIVEVGDHVEVGANTTIDRGAVGTTSIGSHTKIDNLVQIGHNVVLGSHCIVCAQVGIAGSCKIGNGVVFGGGSGVADHVTITSGVRLAGRAGVYSDLLEPGDYMGLPAVKAGIHRRQHALLSRLLKKRANRKTNDDSA